MGQTSYEALINTPIPRDPKVVLPYLRKGTQGIRRFALFFAVFFPGMALTVGALVANDSPDWWGTFAKGAGFMLLLSFLLAGPVLLFLHVNRTSLRRLAENGQLLPAHVSAIDEMPMRGKNLFMATLDFTDVTGRRLQATFQGPEAEQLAVGHRVYVLRALGTSVGVIWPPDVLVLARIR